MLTLLKTASLAMLVLLMAGSGVWAQESGPWRLTTTSYQNGMTDKKISASRLSTVDLRGSGCILSVSNSGGKAFMTVELHNDVIAGNVVGVLALPQNPPLPKKPVRCPKTPKAEISDRKVI